MRAHRVSGAPNSFGCSSYGILQLEVRAAYVLWALVKFAHRPCVLPDSGQRWRLIGRLSLGAWADTCSSSEQGRDEIMFPPQLLLPLSHGERRNLGFVVVLSVRTVVTSSEHGCSHGSCEGRVCPNRRGRSALTGSSRNNASAPGPRKAETRGAAYPLRRRRVARLAAGSRWSLRSAGTGRFAPLRRWMENSGDARAATEA